VEKAMTLGRFVCVSVVVLLFAPGPAWAQAGRPDGEPVTLPPTIPIFPLQDVMLFPNVSRPLHIFEPRYRAMVADALKGDRIIGMVLLQPGYESDYEGRPPVYAIGCAGVITDVEALPDGRYLIMLRGLVKFRVNSEDQSRVYRLAHVQAIPDTASDEDRAALRERRQRLTTLLAAAAPPGSAPPPPALSDEDLVNTLAQYLDLEPIDRQELLERAGPLARSEALIKLLDTSDGRRR
jgi:uncharacterized protein